MNLSLFSIHFFTKTLMHTIKNMFFMSLCQKTCLDDIKHLHELKCPKFFKIGSLRTCKKWYKLFGIVWSLSSSVPRLFITYIMIQNP